MFGNWCQLAGTTVLLVNVPLSKTEYNKEYEKISDIAEKNEYQKLIVDLKIAKFCEFKW